MNRSKNNITPSMVFARLVDQVMIDPAHARVDRLAHQLDHLIPTGATWLSIEPAHGARARAVLGTIQVLEQLLGGRGHYVKHPIESQSGVECIQVWWSK